MKPGARTLGILGIRRHHQEFDAHPRPRSRAIGQRKDLAKGHLVYIEEGAGRFAERAAMHKETPEPFRGAHTAKVGCMKALQTKCLNFKTVFLTKAFVLAAVAATVQPRDEALDVEAVILTTYAIGCVDSKIEHAETHRAHWKCVRKDHDTFAHIMTY